MHDIKQELETPTIRDLFIELGEYVQKNDIESFPVDLKQAIQDLKNSKDIWLENFVAEEFNLYLRNEYAQLASTYPAKYNTLITKIQIKLYQMEDRVRTEKLRQAEEEFAHPKSKESKENLERATLSKEKQIKIDSIKETASKELEMLNPILKLKAYYEDHKDEWWIKFFFPKKLIQGLESDFNDPTVLFQKYKEYYFFRNSWSFYFMFYLFPEVFRNLIQNIDNAETTKDYRALVGEDDLSKIKLVDEKIVNQCQLVSQRAALNCLLVKVGFDYYQTRDFKLDFVRLLKEKLENLINTDQQSLQDPKIKELIQLVLASKNKNILQVIFYFIEKKSAIANRDLLISIAQDNPYFVFSRLNEAQFLLLQSKYGRQFHKINNATINNYKYVLFPTNEIKDLHKLLNAPELATHGRQLQEISTILPDVSSEPSIGESAVDQLVSLIATPLGLESALGLFVPFMKNKIQGTTNEFQKNDPVEVEEEMEDISIHSHTTTESASSSGPSESKERLLTPDNPKFTSIGFKENDDSPMDTSTHSQATTTESMSDSGESVKSSPSPARKRRSIFAGILPDSLLETSEEKIDSILQKTPLFSAESPEHHQQYVVQMLDLEKSKQSKMSKIISLFPHLISTQVFQALLDNPMDDMDYEKLLTRINTQEILNEDVMLNVLSTKSVYLQVLQPELQLVEEAYQKKLESLPRLQPEPQLEEDYLKKLESLRTVLKFLPKISKDMSLLDSETQRKVSEMINFLGQQLVLSMKSLQDLQVQLKIWGKNSIQNLGMTLSVFKAIIQKGQLLNDKMVLDVLRLSQEELAFCQRLFLIPDMPCNLETVRSLQKIYQIYGEENDILELVAARMPDILPVVDNRQIQHLAKSDKSQFKELLEHKHVEAYIRSFTQLMNMGLKDVNYRHQLLAYPDLETRVNRVLKLQQLKNNSVKFSTLHPKQIMYLLGMNAEVLQTIEALIPYYGQKQAMLMDLLFSKTEVNWAKQLLVFQIIEAAKISQEKWVGVLEKSDLLNQTEETLQEILSEVETFSPEQQQALNASLETVLPTFSTSLTTPTEQIEHGRLSEFARAVCEELNIGESDETHLLQQNVNKLQSFAEVAPYFDTIRPQLQELLSAKNNTNWVNIARIFKIMEKAGIKENSLPDVFVQIQGQLMELLSSEHNTPEKHLILILNIIQAAKIPQTLWLDVLKQSDLLKLSEDELQKTLNAVKQAPPEKLEALNASLKTVLPTFSKCCALASSADIHLHVMQMDGGESDKKNIEELLTGLAVSDDLRNKVLGGSYQTPWASVYGALLCLKEFDLIHDNMPITSMLINLLANQHIIDLLVMLKKPLAKQQLAFKTEVAGYLQKLLTQDPLSPKMVSDFNDLLSKLTTAKEHDFRGILQAMQALFADKPAITSAPRMEYVEKTVSDTLNQLTDGASSMTKGLYDGLRFLSSKVGQGNSTSASLDVEPNPEKRDGVPVKGRGNTQ